MINFDCTLGCFKKTLYQKKRSGTHHASACPSSKFKAASRHLKFETLLSSWQRQRCNVPMSYDAIRLCASYFCLCKKHNCFHRQECKSDAKEGQDGLLKEREANRANEARGNFFRYISIFIMFEYSFYNSNILKTRFVPRIVLILVYGWFI